MFKKISTILIWSGNYKKLSDWYKNTFDLKIIEQLDHPKDTGILFELPEGGCRLWIGQHSKVKGQSKDPHRIMFNIGVDSVEKAYKHLLSKEVVFLAKPFKAPTFDKYFATLYDLDGNLVQIIGPK